MRTRRTRPLWPPSLHSLQVLLAAFVVLAAPLAVPAPAATAADGAGCAGMERRLVVPGAERRRLSCLADLTTAGTTRTGHTDPADWAGLHATGTANPSGVPGIQIDGYFPDTSTANTTHGWHHDSQFVIRLPQRWNGGLVVAGSPGVREQYANDFTIGDWVLDRGYAFAATDKGNVGAEFYRDGRRPGGAVAEWNRRVTQLTVAAKVVVAQRYRHWPDRTYAAGISNGGYLVRWQLEHHPQLYDGGIDWEGTLWRGDGPNLFTFLPPALRHYPDYAATGDPDAHQAMLDAGFAPGSEFLWPFHHSVYWDLTQRIYREEFDPEYDGDLAAGVPFCAPGSPGCDADYDYAARPRSVRAAVDRVSLTGRIRKPLITLHGTLDTLLPIGVSSDTYAGLIREQGRDQAFRYYRLAGGNHVDGLYDAYPDRLRPILPCFRDAFGAMERWVDTGAPPPPSATLERPPSGDLVNQCSLDPGSPSGTGGAAEGSAQCDIPPIGLAECHIAPIATPAQATLPRLNVSGSYVAGLSSGAYMATQLHVAYSGTFRGAAIVSGGPYYCAQGDLNRALLACMNSFQDRQLSRLQELTSSWSGQGLVDPVANLSGDPVYVFHGTQDNTVQRPVNDDLVRYYRHFGANVSYHNTTAAGHAWISPLGPNPCGTSYPPYINNCGIDPQRTMLQTMLGSVRAPNTGSPTGTLLQFDQNGYAVGGSASALSMGGTGFAYVPQSCASGASCRLLVALHGCQQSHSTIGTRFVTSAYLNQYADTNDLVVLYPQAAPTWGSNPNGCWDWWGYLDRTSYARYGGRQIESTMRMVRAIGG